MSVCTGAFQLAKAGLLSGKTATTHHDFTDRLAKMFPDIEVKRGLRFVEGDRVSTAGGFSPCALSIDITDVRSLKPLRITWSIKAGDGWCESFDVYCESKPNAPRRPDYIEVSGPSQAIILSRVIQLQS